MHSVWLETTALPKFEQLEKERKTDVLVIGGGMAGILCAYQRLQCTFALPFLRCRAVLGSGGPALSFCYVEIPLRR